MPTATAAASRAPISVTITGTNDAPVVAATDVTGGGDRAGHPGGQPHRQRHHRFTDVDLTDIHSVSAVTPSAGALGSLTASVTHRHHGQRPGRRGDLELQRGGRRGRIPGGGSPRSRPSASTCSTTQGGSVPRTVSVTITGTNDAPVVAATDVTGGGDRAGHPGGNLTDSGTIAFTDVDLTDIHSVSAVTPSAGALGS